MKLNEILQENKPAQALAFLQSLSAEEREDVRKEMIRIHKSNRIYRMNNYMQECEIVAYVHFFCFRAEDHEYLRMMWRDLPKLDEMESLLENEIPSGFPSLFAAFLLNRLLNKDLYGMTAISYQDFMRWSRKGYVSDCPPYVAMRMDDIFPRNAEPETRDAKLRIEEQLASYPEIIEKQIDYLFDYPNEISYSDKSGTIKVGKSGAWTYILKTYTQNGQLDRLKYLRKCLTALGHNYKKDQLNWFADLFVGMEPTDDELLSLQDDLLSVLSFPLTKAVNMALGMLKRIACTKNFRARDFLNAVPVLVSSATKAIVISTIAVLEKRAAKDKNIHTAIGIQLAPVFLNREESVQIRAAKLLVKISAPENEIKKVLLPYSDSMLIATKQLLRNYFSDGSTSSAQLLESAASPESVHSLDSAKPAIPAHIREENRIIPVSTTEDLLFYLGQVFGKFSPVDFYILPETLLRMQDSITEAFVAQTGPALQSAYRIVTNYNPARSFHLNLTAFFFLKYSQIMFARFPKGNKELDTLRDTYDPLFQYVDRWFETPVATGDSYVAWNGFKHLVLYWLKKCETNDPQPILCTPTHTPTWIDPKSFIARLKQYAESNQEPDSMDLQQALFLCAREHSKEATIAYVRKEFTGEYKDLLTYFFDSTSSLPDHLPHKEWWLTAAIANPERNVPEELLAGYAPPVQPYLRNKFDWEPYIHVCTAYIDIDPVTGEEKPFIRHDSRLKFNIEQMFTGEVEYLGLFPAYLYTWYPGSATLMTNIVSIMLSVPNNWQTIIAKLVWENIQYASDSIGKHMIPVLEIFRQTKTKAYDMDILYLILCMLQKDKTLQAYTADTWAEQTGNGLIDNTHLGQTLGKFIAIEYAPLKRVTDTIQQMIGRSPFLDKALSQMLTECLTIINNKPITGLTKLKSIHKELLG